MINFQLTGDEFFAMQLIVEAQEGHDEYISMFFSECQLGSSLKSILHSLQLKGVIEHSYVVPEDGAVFKPENVVWQDKVLEAYKTL